ncbi:Nod factor export ATP-binding protein I [uncultured Alphaproteobacteria bacterium]|uniref:Nod factor export ATP-binding protein I n=1 Tax=uncultured Alphaproteobacteria bacterium TaxID=91750 RepID=A0A212JVV0_9PROT|nr:Nod factor export ATP-binding protein I [uncultured Alphaproteobacteria bacterium]
MSAGDPAAIAVADLRKDYGGVRALDGVSFAVPPGELFAYLGPNGAGKSTTIRILTGLTRKSGGRAVLGGADIDADPIGAKRRCGVVMQHVNLDGDLSLAENMDIHGRLFGMDAADRRARTAELLEVVGLADRADRLVNTLSGGMKRRLMIARALMHRPSILFLDEPTVGLDADIRRRIWGLIKQIQKQGATVFLTTHYIEEAEFLADRVAFLDAGQIRALDAPQALIARVGGWAFDRLGPEGMTTQYFADRATAQAAIAADADGLTLRRANLEDAFLTLTGKAVR